MDLTRTIQVTQRARNTVRYARNLGIARKEARVRTECATHAAKPAIRRANVIHDAKHAAAPITETLEASSALSISVRNAKARWIPKGTIRTTAPRAPYVKHAAAQTTKTLGASNALSTSVRNAKARWIPKGHNKNNYPEILCAICTLCEEVGHDEERCPTKGDNSCPG